jgi:hypothetical protein
MSLAPGGRARDHGHVASLRARLRNDAATSNASSGNIHPKRSPTRGGAASSVYTEATASGVDNDTRGTVRHVHARGILIETDARLLRALPAGYVAEHVEHAYALTGHGVQGRHGRAGHRRCEPARALARLVLYRALPRPRTNHDYSSTTQPTPRHSATSSVPAHAGSRLTRTRSWRGWGAGCSSATTRTLAIDQLPTPGGADNPDNPELIQPLITAAPQEEAADRAEPKLATGPRMRLGEMRAQLERLRAQLQALPTRELTQLDELDAGARTLSERRDLLRGELDRLPAPRERRFGRRDDDHLADRTRLSSALAGAEDQLERTLTERATLGRRLGDPGAIRDERDALTSATTTLQHAHTQLRNELAERELAERPAWARHVLGERPLRASDAERWDRAARTIARYRIEYAIPDTGDELGPRPTDREQRVDYERARRAREQLTRARDTPGHEVDVS